jgi:hypothetical protein
MNVSLYFPEYYPAKTVFYGSSILCRASGAPVFIYLPGSAGEAVSKLPDHNPILLVSRHQRSAGRMFFLYLTCLFYDFRIHPVWEISLFCQYPLPFRQIAIYLPSTTGTSESNSQACRQTTIAVAPYPGHQRYTVGILTTP